VYVTSHPFISFQQILSKILVLIKDLSAQGRKQWVVVGGVISSVKKKITRDGKPMSFVTIEDTTGSLELLVFPRTYETTKDIWVEGQMACVVGRTSEDEGDDKLFVEKAYVLNKDNVDVLNKQLSINQGWSSVRQYAPSMNIEEQTKLDNFVIIEVTKELLKTKADAIKDVLRKYHGDTPVYLLVDGKKIKTSFKVSSPNEVEIKIKQLLSSEI